MAQWSVPCAEIARRLNKRVETVVREAAFEIFSKVVARTPVGETGRLRGNWNISLGSPDYSVSDVGGSGPDLQGVLFNMPAGSVVWLSNALPYAAVVEYGWFPNPPKHGTGKTRNGYSTQAPGGMVRISVREFDMAVRRAANKAGVL